MLIMGHLEALHRKTDLENATQKKRKNFGNANLHFYSGHRWILTASELVSSWFCQYNLLQDRGEKGVVPKWRPLYKVATTVVQLPHYSHPAM